MQVQDLPLLLAVKALAGSSPRAPAAPAAAPPDLLAAPATLSFYSRPGEKLTWRLLAPAGLGAGNQPGPPLYALDPSEQSDSLAFGYDAVLASDPAGCRLEMRGSVDFDGHVKLSVRLRPSGPGLRLADAVLRIAMPAATVSHAVGLGYPGGAARDLDWTWRGAAGQQSPNAIWCGGPDGGLRLQLYPDGGREGFASPAVLSALPGTWRVPIEPSIGSGIPWAGGASEQAGHVSVQVSAHAGAGAAAAAAAVGGAGGSESRTTANITASTGPLFLDGDCWVSFNAGLLPTPVKPMNHRKLFGDRYFHLAYGARRLVDPATLQERLGANVVVVHHGKPENPYINYPFSRGPSERLAAYVREAHARGMRVKLYYTIRELSSRAVEFFALRALGSEVLLGAPDTEGRAAPRANAFLRQFAPGGDYTPAWATSLEDSGELDLAVGNRGDSRWANYYMEGLRWLVSHPGGPLIDGVYIDGVAYSGETMQRVRRILDDAHADRQARRTSGQGQGQGQVQQLQPPLVDLHSGPGNLRDALHFPYLDSLWVGEGIDYRRGPDYWLVVISGVPWGMPSQTLGADSCSTAATDPRARNSSSSCTFLFRGLVFGLTNRAGWSGGGASLDSNANADVWRIWDAFGIAEAKVWGWWERRPVLEVLDAATGRPLHDIKATAFVRRPRGLLVALASWSSEDREVQLRVHWSRLADVDHRWLRAAARGWELPGISGFQAPRTLRPGEAIHVAGVSGGALLVAAHGKGRE